MKPSIECLLCKIKRYGGLSRALSGGVGLGNSLFVNRSYDPEAELQLVRTTQIQEVGYLRSDRVVQGLFFETKQDLRRDTESLSNSVDGEQAGLLFGAFDLTPEIR